MYRYGLILLLFIILSACRTGDDSLLSEEPPSSELSPETESPLSGGALEPVGTGEILQEETDWLSEAQRAWFDLGDPERTDYCLDRVERATLDDDSRRSLYQLLCRKVYTRELPLREKGFADRNISALYLDRDDLWMGTWTGGIVRYSLPLEDLTTMRESRDSLRVEKISDFEGQGSNLHIAGYSDLYRYEKKTSLMKRSYPEGMARVNNLSYYRGVLYASTVNQGLWRESGEGNWTRLGKDIPGLGRINTLYVDNRDTLLIGTASEGIISYDGGTFRNYRQAYPSFTGRNITAISESGALLMIGTYGEGAFLLDREGGKSFRYSKEGGDFSSDYILCTYMGERWLYAGTLGGGLYALDRRDWGSGGRWIPLGLDEGLNSLDAAALVGYGKFLYVSLLGQGILILDEEIIEKAL